MVNDPNWGLIQIFSYVYIGLLVGTLITSLAVPLDKGIFYFRLLSGIFSSFTIFSLIGIATFLAETGFYPIEKEYDLKHEIWKDVKDKNGNVITHFSVLTFSGVIMLSVYFIPMILRPIDFI